ncbi:tetratricopeptide repeat protein [Corynebacterium hindlerae]|nr:tetratricopeptide repeat protein [Corynebacterium hindlerae]
MVENSRNGGHKRGEGPRRGNGKSKPRGDKKWNNERRKGGHGKRRHSQRGGAGRNDGKFHAGPNRAGFREERMESRQQHPDIPSDIDVHDLDPSVLQDLRSLAKDNADAVAKHMIMAATWMADDPKLALRHARAAKDRGGRVSVVRETAGIAAYHAGEWKEALAELRAAKRMSGGPGLVAVMADCERALGKPEKALELAREVNPQELDKDTRIELAIVAAGARHDLGQHEAAVVELSKVDPRADAKGMSASRLMYAYADALLGVGRKNEAKQWFEHAQRADVDGFLDTKDRLKELS